MDLSKLHAPGVLMITSLIMGSCGGSRCGEADAPSLMKTLWNWSRRPRPTRQCQDTLAYSLLAHISARRHRPTPCVTNQCQETSAYSLLSHISFPFFCQGANPMLSCLAMRFCVYSFSPTKTRLPSLSLH